MSCCYLHVLLLFACLVVIGTVCLVVILMYWIVVVMCACTHTSPTLYFTHTHSHTHIHPPLVFHTDHRYFNAEQVERENYAKAIDDYQVDLCVCLCVVCKYRFYSCVGSFDLPTIHYHPHRCVHILPPTPTHTHSHPLRPTHTQTTGS